MKVIRTSNLHILSTWILGGQVDPMGNECDGDHSFTKEECNYQRKTNGKFDLDKIKEGIIFNIEEYGSKESGHDPFEFYGDYYRFKVPCAKNLNILAKRIKRDLEEMESWD